MFKILKINLMFIMQALTGAYCTLWSILSFNALITYLIKYRFQSFVVYWETVHTNHGAFKSKEHINAKLKTPTAKQWRTHIQPKFLQNFNKKKLFEDAK